MKIRRLFWTLFFSFWLGNAIMLAGVTLFIIATVESSHIQERHRQLYETIASTVVEAHESGAIQQAKRWQKWLRNNHQIREFKHHFAMRIVDANENEIINIRFQKDTGDEKKRLVFVIESESGEKYRVETYKRPPPPFIREAIRRFNIMQIIAVLFSSAVVAGLLSWHLSRPLEALRQFTQSYSGDEKDNDIAAHLLARGDEIGDLARELHSMSARVQQNFSNQKDLLHYVSHELRAPLARLQTVAGLAEQRVPDSKDFIEKIHQECQNINTLIESILQYSRLEHVALVRKNVALEELMAGVVSTVGRSYPSAIINMRIHENLAGCSINIDEDRMFHALENILQNACKYGDQRSAIDFFAAKEGEQLMLCVENVGQSLSPEALARIFEPFYRAGNTMHTDGHGLGLSIANRSIMQHGGEVLASNREGGGIKVRIFLPL